MEEDADVIALRNLQPRKMSRGSSGMSARRWTTDVRRQIRRNSRFGKRRREKIAARNIFAGKKNRNPHISERGATSA